MKKSMTKKIKMLALLACTGMLISPSSYADENTNLYKEPSNHWGDLINKGRFKALYSDPFSSDSSDSSDPSSQSGVPSQYLTLDSKKLENAAKKLPCNINNRPKNFKFCSKSSEVNMMNAFWMSCLAANQYESFHHVFLDLKKNLKFGASSDKNSDKLNQLVDKIYGLWNKVKADKNPELVKWVYGDKEISAKKYRATQSVEDKPYNFEETMMQKQWLVDQVVHYSLKISKSQSKSLPISFLSTRVAGADSSKAIKVMAKDFSRILKESGLSLIPSIISSKAGLAEDTEAVDYDFKKVGGTQAMWAEYKDFVVISVRGTEPPKDLSDYEDYIDAYTDATAFQLMFDHRQKFGKKKKYTSFVHMGFNAAFSMIYEGMISKKIAELKSSSRKTGVQKPVFVTGHSLGGAVATLIARRILSDNYKPWIYQNKADVIGDPTKVKQGFVHRVKNSLSHELKRGNKKVSQAAFCNEYLPPADSAAKVSYSKVPANVEAMSEYWKSSLENILSNNQPSPRNFVKLGGLYTFGSPRVGDETFKRTMECMAKRSGTVIARFRNNEDFVPTVPHYNEYAMLPYQHIGSQIVLSDLRDENGNLRPDGKREAYMEIPATKTIGSAYNKMKVRSLKDFYSQFDKNKGYNEKYIPTFGENCEPKTTCFAHGSPYYLIQRKGPTSSTNDIISTMLSGIKNGAKSFVASKFGYFEDSLFYTFSDHSMAPAAGSKGAGTTYFESIRNYIDLEEEQVNCASYDITNAVDSKIDVVLTNDQRENLHQSIKEMSESAGDNIVGVKDNTGTELQLNDYIKYLGKAASDLLLRGIFSENKEVHIHRLTGRNNDKESRRFRSLTDFSLFDEIEESVDMTIALNVNELIKRKRNGSWNLMTQEQKDNFLENAESKYRKKLLDSGYYYGILDRVKVDKNGMVQTSDLVSAMIELRNQFVQDRDRLLFRVPTVNKYGL